MHFHALRAVGLFSLARQGGYMVLSSWRLSLCKGAHHPCRQAAYILPSEPARSVGRTHRSVRSTRTIEPGRRRRPPPYFREYSLLPSDVSPPTGIYQLMNHLLRLPQRTPAPLRGPLPLKGAQGYCAQRTANSVYLLSSIFYLLSSTFYLLSSIFYLLSSTFYFLSRPPFPGAGPGLLLRCPGFPVSCLPPSGRGQSVLYRGQILYPVLPQGGAFFRLPRR